jgi:oxygen-dependent protoporphyrinogen oxidase
LDGFQIEVGATSFLDSKPTTLDLCREIGLEEDLIAARAESRNRYILLDHRLNVVPSTGAEFLRSGLLSWRGKLRLLGERWIRSRGGIDESVGQFARRRIGREAADVLVDAMVTGIHAGDPELLSVAAAFPRMVQLEQKYGSLFRAMAAIRRERRAQAAVNQAQTPAADDRAHGDRNSAPAGPGGTPWSLRGGMGQIIERLADNPHASMVSGTLVRCIHVQPAGTWSVESTGGERWQADAVVLACPSFAQAEMVEPFDRELASLLREIPYNSVTVVALGFRKSQVAAPLDGFGYLIPQRTRSNVLGVLWNSSIFENRSPAEMVLLQAMCGGWNRPDMIEWGDQRLVASVLEELRHTMKIAAAPVLSRVIRWPQAIPQYHVGHLARVARIEAQRRRHRRLYLTGNAFRGVSVNDCTEESARCAGEVLNDLGAAHA